MRLVYCRFKSKKVSSQFNSLTPIWNTQKIFLYMINIPVTYKYILCFFFIELPIHYSSFLHIVRIFQWVKNNLCIKTVHVCIIYRISNLMHSRSEIKLQYTTTLKCEGKVSTSRIGSIESNQFVQSKNTFFFYYFNLFFLFGRINEILFGPLIFSHQLPTL